MTWVSVNVDSGESQRYFDYAGYRARDMREPLRKTLWWVIIPGIQEQFETSGSRSGGWQPLSPKYLAEKVAAGFPEDILIRTGLLNDSFFADGGMKMTYHELDYHPPVPEYGYYHQDGEGKNPWRPMLVYTRDDEEQIEDIWRDWLNDLRASNRRRGDIGDAPAAPAIYFRGST